MTDKNLLYFVTRMNLAVHGIDLHFSKAQLYLLELLRQKQGAIADIEGIDDVRPVEIVEEARQAKACVIAAAHIAHEFNAWFRHDCPPPTKKRNLKKGMETLNALFRSTIAFQVLRDGNVERTAASSGVYGVVNLQRLRLESLRDALELLGKTVNQKSIEAAYKKNDLVTLAEHYQEHHPVTRLISQVSDLQTAWSEMALRVWLKE